MLLSSQPLRWLHIGDLHMTRAGEENHRTLLRIARLVRGLAPGAIDFALLPGDNAENGTPEQFTLVHDAVADFPVPLHIISGDHDIQPGSLDNFYNILGTATLPYAAAIRGHRCLFLDMVSAGLGGPDFRLDPSQLAWIEQQIGAAEAAGETVIVFMHTYPADLTQGGDDLRALLARSCVLCADMGHTHYNELANDGGTIFMATRSTGQIEEGAPGFSIAAIDEGGVSWRFKPVDRAWPFVLITSPVDRRLVTDRSPAAFDPAGVRATILGDAPIAAAEISIDDGAWHPMSPAGDETAVWHAPMREGARIAVRARDAQGRTDIDIVEPASGLHPPTPRHADGSDADRIGAWPERHILGTQLGPNRNGRSW